MKASIEQMISCAQREVKMRKRAYPRWVEQGKMTEAQAFHEKATMESIVSLLEELRATGEATFEREGFL
jgi:hypothetical protein